MNVSKKRITRGAFLSSLVGGLVLMSIPRKTLGLKPEADAFRDFGIVGDGSDEMRKWQKAVNGCSVLGVRPPEAGKFYGVDAGRSGALLLPSNFTLIVEEPESTVMRRLGRTDNTVIRNADPRGGFKNLSIIGPLRFDGDTAGYEAAIGRKLHSRDQNIGISFRCDRAAARSTNLHLELSMESWPGIALRIFNVDGADLTLENYFSNRGGPQIGAGCRNVTIRSIRSQQTGDDAIAIGSSLPNFFSAAAGWTPERCITREVQIHSVDNHVRTDDRDGYWGAALIIRGAQSVSVSGPQRYANAKNAGIVVSSAAQGQPARDIRFNGHYVGADGNPALGHIFGGQIDADQTPSIAVMRDSNFDVTFDGYILEEAPGGPAIKLQGTTVAQYWERIAFKDIEVRTTDVSKVDVLASNPERSGTIVDLDVWGVRHPDGSAANLGIANYLTTPSLVTLTT